MVADPQGTPFYVMKPIPPEGEPKPTATSSRSTRRSTFAGTSCRAADPDGAVAFYGEPLRLEPATAIMDMGEMGEYRFFAARRHRRIGAIMPAMPRHAGPHVDATTSGVDDIDRAAEAVKANGGKIVNGPMEIPGGEFAIIGMRPAGRGSSPWSARAKQ